MPRNRAPSRFDKASVMTDREKALFKTMWENPSIYSAVDIGMRFGISRHYVPNVAKNLKLKGNRRKTNE